MKTMLNDMSNFILPEPLNLVIEKLRHEGYFCSFIFQLFLHLFSYGNNPDVLQLMNGSKNVQYIHSGVLLILKE
jgi:hypothetical protein